LYGIIAYQYNKLGDSINAKLGDSVNAKLNYENAKLYFEEFFKRENANKIGPADYETYAMVLLKFPGNEILAGTFIDKAVELAVTEDEKVILLKSLASTYEKRKLFNDAALWYKKVVDLRKITTKTDLFNTGYSFYRSGNPQKTIEIFNQYTQKFPDDILGHYWVGKASSVIDTTMTLALAIPSYEKVILLGEALTDKTKNKTQIMTAYKYMIAYMANIKKDKVAALAYCDKALLLDPTDADVINNKESISKMNMNPTPTKPIPKLTVKPVTPVKPAGTKPPAKAPVK
jgi:tetratricopeptide (TPR) repeat protein